MRATMSNYRDETEALAHENQSLRNENAELRARLAGNAPPPQPARTSKPLVIALAIGSSLVLLGATGLVLMLNTQAPLPPPVVQPAAVTAHVVMGADESLLLDGVPVTRSALLVQMQTLAAARPGLRVRISTDRALEYQRVVALMEALRTAGVHNLALNTQR